MIAISKSSVIPQTLLPANTTERLNVLETKIQAGQELKSKDFDTSVYGADDVRGQLKLDQHGKCAYCESNILAINGGEVEHYRPKTTYKDVFNGATKRPAYYRLAYEWTNLLAACPTCNKNKGSYFPLANPNQRDITCQQIHQETALIINPCYTNPDNHLEYRAFMLYPKTDDKGVDDIFGRATIEYLKLNRGDLVELRRRAWVSFVKDMTDNNLTYDECLGKLSDRMQSIGCTIEDIDYLDMYKNQTLRAIFS